MDRSLAENSNLMRRLLIAIEAFCMKFQGVLLKSIAFDKGWSFLCIFGLPGIIVKNKASAALGFAVDLMNRIANKFLLSDLDQHQFPAFDNFSIGIATGLSYCGVIGHHERHEYTCIGDRINLSARLSVNYPNTISCDDETYWVSNLDPSLFYQLPTKALKGIRAGQVIRAIVWEENLALRERDDEFFFVGHRLELALIATQVILLCDPHRKSNRKFFFFQSPPGYGSTAFINYIGSILRKSPNQKLITITIELADDNKPFSGLRQILKKMLNETVPIIDQSLVSTRETDKLTLSKAEKILHGLTDENSHEDSSSQDPDECIEELMAMIAVNDLSVVLCIDQVHSMDIQSILSLGRLHLNCLNLLIIGTIKAISTLDSDRQKGISILSNQGCSIARLRVLSMVDIVRVICSQFKVNCVEASIV
ncbi:hypothetical protein ACOME3_004101 [Neoechinorhynchus agilis]